MRAKGRGIMAENAKEMGERHRRELEELRNNCPHKEISAWMPYMWAPGHYGPDCKVCLFCEKMMETKGKDTGKKGE